MTREQMLDKAVRRVAGPDLIRVLRSGRRSVNYFRSNINVPNIRAEFRRLSNAA